MEILLSYGLYILLGVFAGLLSGLLGVGGGVIVVPGFIWLFQEEGIPHNIVMHMAAGTSLAAMIVTAAFSLYAHIRRGAVFGSILYLMIPWLVVGTAGGAVLGHFIHSHILKIMFGLLAVLIALKEFFSTRAKANNHPKKHYLGSIGIVSGTTGIGIVSGLLGVGGGTLMVPFLEYCGITMKNAVSISVACGLVVALTGTASVILTGFHVPNLPPHSIGYIYLPAFIGVSIGSPLIAFIGTMLHHRLKGVVLKRLFSVFLIFVGLQLLM